MRVETETGVVQAAPGSTVDVVVDVVNTGDLIDGLTARLVGLEGATFRVEPQLLPLFPGARGQLKVSVDLPSTLPAGSHPVAVEVISHASDEPNRYVDVDLSVSANPAVRLSRTPQTIRARRAGRFLLDVENTGNTALDVRLEATKEDARTTARFAPASFRVDPGTKVPAILALRGPRMFTGAEIDRTALVTLTARRAHVIAAMEETESEPELTTETTVVLRQRPLVGRGLLTALILFCIVGLWAGAFLLGLSRILGNDPLDMAPGASFWETLSDTDLANAASATPIGALPKTGRVPPAVGGTISGTVVADSNRAPVGRILVEAYRDGSDEAVLRAATDDDGAYSLSGLFPTDYRLLFTAPGFDELWYPSPPGGDEVLGVAAQTTTLVDDEERIIVVGKPASISGQVDQGSAVNPVPTTVTARAVDLDGYRGPDRTQAAAVATGERGEYTLTGLASPATYQLSFKAEGYRVKTLITTVGGGEDRQQPSVVPGAGTGQITGVVTDGTTGLGGVTVSTTVDGAELTVVTPTVGAIGSYTLGNLPTPGTYVITYTLPGFGSTVEVVDLDPGQRAQQRTALAEGTGTITGRLIGVDRQGLGGATVSVGGLLAGGQAPTTTTLTAGSPEQVGSFSIAGLEAPGEYTLTFERAGYASQTVPVHLDDTGSASIDAQMALRLGSVAGVVTGPSGPFIGATVTVTNGTETWTATSGRAGGGLENGGFLLPDLPPGRYSVTASADRMQQQTGLITVYPGLRTVRDLRLTRDGR